MGVGPGDPGAGIPPYRKEFWWEREWRHVGDFNLPNTYMILCPTSEMRDIDQFVKSINEDERPRISFIDPSWSLESIIGKLAGFTGSELGPF